MDVPDLIAITRQKAGLTQSQLASRAGTSQAAVARYEAGRVSPSFSTLKRLVRAAGADLVVEVVEAPASNLSGHRARKLKLMRHEILERARSLDVHNVRIFGSVARSEDDVNSDIDLLVDFDISRGLVAIAELTVDLSELLGEHVDVAPAKMLRSDVLKNALREAVPL
ncbi:MAG TPA: helix-turn-helix domain-containing protein [Candidatus Nanopelagicaceae bacterium]|nr:helix-turn-helix domain-containing protein [Candidatus Nanopelagicaceae bacterium]